ncbi:MAG: isochorismatase family protein [Acidimicrobiales bacterium]
MQVVGGPLGRARSSSRRGSVPRRPRDARPTRRRGSNVPLRRGTGHGPRRARARSTIAHPTPGDTAIVDACVPTRATWKPPASIATVVPRLPALHDLLVEAQRHHLVVVGATTSVCVESTVRDAMFRDYHCLLLEDCTAEPSPSTPPARTTASISSSSCCSRRSATPGSFLAAIGPTAARDVEAQQRGAPAPGTTC